MATQTPVPSQAPAKITTAEELLTLSQDDSRRYELIEGVLVTMAPAGFAHGNIVMSLGARLRLYAEDNNLGIVCSADTGFKLQSDPDTVVAPDVSFVATERLGGEALTRSYFPGAPDLAVEVVSPTDIHADVSAKVQLLLSHGTRLIWVIEPRPEIVTVYRSNDSVSVLRAGDALDGEDVLPGFTFPVNRLFQ